MATSILKNPILKKYLVEAGIGGMIGGAAGAAIATKNEESGEGRVAATLTGLAAGAALPFAAGQAIRAIRFGKGFPKKVKSDVRYNSYADSIKDIESRRAVVNEQLKNFNYSQALERAHADQMTDAAKKGLGLRAGRFVNRDKPLPHTYALPKSTKDTRTAIDQLSSGLYKTDKRISELYKAKKDPTLLPPQIGSIQDRINKLQTIKGEGKELKRSFSGILHGAQSHVKKQQDLLKGQSTSMGESLKKVRQEQKEYIEKMRKQFHTDIYGKWLGVF